MRDGARLNEKFRQFKKGYLPEWMEELFVVSGVKKGRVPTYKVNEWESTLVKGTFYTKDLQVTEEDDDLFREDRETERG